tara:strand:- start:170 stop:1201 length:1032 start_codon:yes stop_codon:yes gene_type:complete
MQNNVEFDVAEVLGYDYTYNWVPYDESNDGFNNNNLFALKVRSCSGYIDRRTFIARPGDNNIKKIPLIGEFVLVFKSYNQYSTNKRTREIWYYLDTINIQSNISNNRLPGLSTSKRLKNNISEDIPAGLTFDHNIKISPLQPYEGDMLLEGRFGNSIRFGSTISTVPKDYYHKSPTWLGDKNGDPIIILSNGRTNLDDKEFVVEDIENDNSSLYLTSTQEIKNIKFSTSTAPSNFNTFEGSNFIGIADRVILRSKKDRVIIDSTKDIILNTPGMVKIGSDEAVIPIPYGDELQTILNKIVNVLAMGNLVQGSIASPIDKPTVKSLKSEIAKMKSTKRYFIQKE